MPLKWPREATLTLFHRIPIIEEAISLAKMGIIPGGAYRNMNYVKDHVEISENTSRRIDCLFDPQTSGGLLISVEKAKLICYSMSLKTTKRPML